MSIFRRLSRTSSRRRSETSSATSNQETKEFESVHHEHSTGRRHSRTHSLGNIFSRRRCKNNLLETYETDFWERNFQDKSTVSWNEFRAAFVLDYKNGIEEFADTGHLAHVLKAAQDKMCNKDCVVYIVRYKRFVGTDPPPDALWLKIKEDATRLVFEDCLIDSLSL